MTTKESALKKIAELVERFTEQNESYKKADYNETLTRRDFIDPFFKALGWDIDNEQGYAQAYREVIHEDRVKIGGAMKAPDYSFRIGGNKRLFFVEAKKPSIYIKDDIIPAYQVRRYGWNAKLSISIVTDFEEFAIYDCTRQPNRKDKASVARINYLTSKDYIPKFDFIWGTFSKESVLKGSFDKYIQGNINKKGTATVDKAFLVTLDQWRTYLATSISWNNKELNEEEINFAVQQTIDRIIFLRIAEGREVEPYGTLQTTIKQGNYYQNLFIIFQDADDKYNSGLFNLAKDKISRNLTIDNKVIRSIINELYYPNSEYEFSVLSVEILGSAYEQFLGKVIRITPAHHAKIEEKPEVRKAGGVFYTPEYIVNYIVKNTVGKLIEGKTPAEISKIRILDPACGSGSFLIGAYQYLIDYHANYYTALGKKSKGGTKEHPLTPEGTLTTFEKKRILLNNIYGVDIDVNAVEVTKLSLLLKCMEGETSASIEHQLRIFHERVLPTLENNIKDGNSLVGQDLYVYQLDFGDEKKIKPFDWEIAFPEVFTDNESVVNPDFRRQFADVENFEKKTKALVDKYSAKEPLSGYGRKGGFDVVIGNPPYLGGREWKAENGNVYNYFISKYKVAEYQFDIYALFWEAGIRLLKEYGLIGYITPNTWLNNQSNRKLRNFMLERTSIREIVDYSKVKVFDQATVLPIITILENSANEHNMTDIYEPTDEGYIKTQCVHQHNWHDGDLSIININLSESNLELRDKIELNTQPLEQLALVKRGIQLYETGKGIPAQKASDAKNNIYEASEKIDDTYIKFLEGKDIFSYHHIWKNRWIKYGINLAAKRDPALFEGDRFAVRRIVGKTLIATYFSEKIGISQLLHIVKPNEPSITKYLLGIINSKMMAFYFRKKYNRQDKTFPEIRIYELASLPIKLIEDSNKSLQTEIIRFVDQLLQLHIEIADVKLQSRIMQLESKIVFFENKINDLVYQLYGLSADEIKIVGEK
jgi:type I restriction-modification system DNA methylase subunit